jgi:hypothetical protein
MVYLIQGRIFHITTEDIEYFVSEKEDQNLC